MDKQELGGNNIRSTFIDFFKVKDHTFVPSSSLVPGGDATLLFTNAGMVQFKDIFLGTEKRPYSRAVNSQKCMRVAGKHNDLEEVGQDDTHHTFFEMLGNWSFGDYYKKEAIQWAWELLTEVWELPKDQFYATVFKDELNEIPTDDDAAGYWRDQPGFNPEHIFYLGRKDNFWEMADTGPCGPCSEIHFDLFPEMGPVTPETLDTERFVELWNLVFIQYNRTGPATLEPLPATHVDTGMGLERIVSVLQKKGSTYRTDLLWPLIRKTQALSGHNDDEREANLTPYRVIADHARAAAFLIADGVVPGNLGRNYVTRMIIRRAYRFGGKIGLHMPFLAQVAETVIKFYGDAYPELIRNQKMILDSITREERQFQRTLEKATGQLENLLKELNASDERTLPGEQAAELYTTYGMPLEITKDIAQERGLQVEEGGFQQAMEEHRRASGAGESMGPLGAEDVDVYRQVRDDLQEEGKLDPDGVRYNPYGDLEFEANLLALVKNGHPVEHAAPEDRVEVLLPQTNFYIEAGGQVSDTGVIAGENWEIRVKTMRKPAAGVIVHVGEVIKGEPKVGDTIRARIDSRRRRDIMRNHTATHLLHAALDKVLGRQARQAGSLVAPDRLRFDFTHPDALTHQELERIERQVNQWILEDHDLNISYKPLQNALDEGARALFGEKYAEMVRTITTGDFSYELCGGTHCKSTGEIALFLITSEGSAAAGIRRIEAITGREAYNLVRKRFDILDQTASILSTRPEKVFDKTKSLQTDLNEAHKQIAQLRQNLATAEFQRKLEDTHRIDDVVILTAAFQDADADTLRQMADRFRHHHPHNSLAVLASVVDSRPILIAAVSKDLVNRGIKAGDLVKHAAEPLGGGGGGRPTLAQAGGKDPSKLQQALDSVPSWVERNLK